LKKPFKILAIVILLSLSSWAEEPLDSRHCTIKTWKGTYLTARFGGGARHGGSLDTWRTTVGRDEIFRCITTGETENGNYIISFQTDRGFYLTAVGGGGRTSDVIHSDAKKILAWEKFSLVSINGNLGWTAIKTHSGHYLTALGGGGGYGGYMVDVMHSNRTWIRDWEKFKIELLPY
jgi:hypothetical protein